MSSTDPTFCSRRRAWCAAASFAGAIAISGGVASHLNHHSQPAARAGVGEMTAVPSNPGDGPNDPSVQAEKAFLERQFKERVNPQEGNTFAYAAAGEQQFEFRRSSQVKEVAISSSCGDVSIYHTERAHVLVLVGKFSLAESYERAREYSRQLNYDLKSDGDRLRITLSQPNEEPDDVSGAVRCLVLAPSSVKVTVNSGGAPFARAF